MTDSDFRSPPREAYLSCSREVLEGLLEPAVLTSVIDSSAPMVA